MKKLILIFTIISLPFMSQADTYSVSNKFYVGFGAGIISPNDVDIDISTAGIVNGVTFSAGISGEFEFDNGYQINGLLGYRITDYLSFETEFGYSNFDYDKVNVTVGGTATSGGVTFTGAASRSYDIDGSISAFSMIFGPTLDFDVYENFEILLGGGIGFSSYNDEIKSVGGSTGLSFDEDFTDFAAKFKTGANYSFSEQTYLQATYGFNFVDSGVENFTDDFTAHSFNANLVYNF